MKLLRAPILTAFFICWSQLALASATRTIDADAFISSSHVNTLTLPAATDTLVGRATTDTLSNKTLDGSSKITSAVTVVDATDTTKQWALSLSGMTTGKTLTLSSSQTTTQTLTIPNITGADTLTANAATQTLTNKTLTTPLTDIIQFSQQSTPSNPPASSNKLYFKSDNNLYMLNSGGTETQVNGGGGGGGSGNLNAKFTLEDATVLYTTIDGPHYQVGTLSLTAVYISMFNSGTSGSTTIRVNQYRSGSLQASATASLSSSSGNPTGAHASLSGTLSLLAGDIITVDVTAVASGAPEGLTVEY